MEEFINEEFSKEDFKADYNKYGGGNLLMQVPHLARLANVYLKKARCQDDQTNWLNYVKVRSLIPNVIQESQLPKNDLSKRILISNQPILLLKAHALLNSCLSRDGKEEQWLPAIYQVEKEYYRGNHSWTEELHRAKTNELKTQLGNLRKEVSTRLEPITKLIGELDIHGEEHSQHQEIMTKMQELIFLESHNCTAQMISLSENVLLASESVISEPIPQYCAVALGSMARGETTPYSDIEYLFLCSSGEDKDVLRKLAIDSYFRMNNFSETSLKYMYIEELHDSYRQHDHRWFEDKAKNGFKIDGFLPHSGNIPTGNTIDDSEDFLIKTPSQLFKLYTEHIHKPLNEASPITGDMSDFLTSTTMFRSHLCGEHLYKKFQRLIDEKLGETDKLALMQKRRETLLKDLKKFSFVPEYLGFSSAFKQREVKMDIFRFPTLYITGMNETLQMNVSSAQLLNALIEKGDATSPLLKGLPFLLAVALYVRLAAYSAYGAQRESLSFMTTHATENTDRYYFPRNLFIKMAVALTRIRSYLSGIGGIKPLDDKLYKAEALLFCGDFTQGLAAIAEWLCTDSLEDYAGISEQLQRRDFSEWPDKMQMIANALEKAGSYALSNSYVKQVILLLGEDTSPSRQSILDHQLGKNFAAMGQFGKAAEHFSECLRNLKSIHGTNENHSNLATCYHHLGMTYADMGQYDMATEFYKRTLEIEINVHGPNSCHPNIASSHHQLGDSYSSMGQYNLAARHTKTCLDMLHVIHGVDSNHPRIALSLYQLGIHYTEAGHHDKAVVCYRKSLEMLKAIHGATANHPNIASSHYQLGMSYTTMGQYNLAAEHYNKSLEICKIIHGTDGIHPDIASTHHQIGANFAATGQFNEAAEHYSKSLKMKMAIHGSESNHPQIANTIHGIGVNYASMGHYDTAEIYLEKSLKMGKIIHGEHNNHPEIATAYHQLGINYASKGQYQKAVEHCNKSLEMKKQVHGITSSHPSIADSHHSLGINYAAMGQYEKAAEQYKKSLGMRKIKYGIDSSHPDIASTLHQMGINYVVLAQYDKAAECYNRCASPIC